MEYIAAAGTVLRGAASGLPVKALMFTLDKPIFHMMARPEIKRIQDLKGKAIAVTAIAATDAVGARAMAKAAGMNVEQDFTIIASGSTAMPSGLYKAAQRRLLCSRYRLTSKRKN